MNIPNAQKLDFATRGSLIAVGRHVDEEVLKGRSLKKVLAEGRRRDAAHWYRPELLRDYSRAVAYAYPAK
jgi:hypothetical protein